MRYDGYNGVLSVEGELLTLIHSGAAAQSGGLPVDQPRRVALQAVSDVAFVDASRSTNGYLTLGIGGGAATVLPTTTAVADPDTILFSWNQRDAFRALYGWLQTVVRYNREHGVDSAAAAVDPIPASGAAPDEQSRRSDRVIPAVDFRSAPPPTGSPLVPVSVPGPRVKELSARKQRAQRRTSFEALLDAAGRGDPGALAQVPAALAEARPDWRSGKLESVLWQVVADAVRRANEDDTLTLEEENQLLTLSSALGVRLGDIAIKAPDAFEELMVCRINSGRPPKLADPPMITKRGETAYGAFDVALMKEVIQREFRGGSSGVSIPVGFGIRYRTGSFRGHSVVVGSELVAEDSGVLVVTNSRAVFTGSKKTLEFRHDRLVGMQQYADGLRLNVSNRQAASLFKFTPGSSPTQCAALISHAVSVI